MSISSKDVNDLNRALTAGMYGYPTLDPVTQGLMDTFFRLDLPKVDLMKSYGAGLSVEDLSVVMKSVTFDEKNIKDKK